LKVETNQLENCEVQLIVELEAEQLNRAKDAAARRLARKVNIPGFRNGKAPYNIILQHLGEDRIVENAVEDLGQRVYKEALAQTEVNPFAPGILVDASLEKTPTFTFNVPVAPSVVLGNYRAVRVQFQPVEIADKAVEEAMRNLQSEHALLEPIERPAQLGDVLTIDAHGTLKRDDEDAEKLADQKDMDLLLEDDSEWSMPGLIVKLVGMKLDEIREFELHFPEDYANENLAGQTVQWSISCKAVKSRTLPKLNDGFAALVSGDYETLLELRVAVREQLEQAATTQKSREYRREVVDAVLQECKISFPPIMLQERVNNMVRQQEQALRPHGLTLPDYLKMENKSEEEYRAEIEPDAVTQLHRSLMLTEVVAMELLQVDEKQVDEQIEKTAAAFEDSADKIRAMLGKGNGRRSVELDLLTEMALERLEAIGKGAAPEIQPEAEPEDTLAENVGDKNMTNRKAN